MDYLEVSAKTVDEAITKASIQLGLSSDQLDIQVISEGSTGFLGFGSKPAVIQVRKKKEEESGTETAAEAEKVTEAAPETKEAAETAPEAEKVAVAKAEAVPKAEETAEKAAEPAAETAAETVQEPAESKSAAYDEPAETEKAEHHRSESKKKREEIVLERPEEEIQLMTDTAVNFLQDVFKAMDMPVEITAKYDSTVGSLDIDFEGEDMGILIGKRGQTLDSLQYLVSQVVNKKIRNYVRVKLDTEDYRRRRKETLENLARNIAYKVRRTRKSVSLEAMNPYERRIIHSALQNNKYVETYSEGVEPYRHVVVALKKKDYDDD